MANRTFTTLTNLIGSFSAAPGSINISEASGMIPEEAALAMANREKFEILIPSFILVVLGVVIGIPGNLVTLHVYVTKMRRNATRVFILALTACDLLNCALTMPLELAIICNFWTFDRPILCKLSRVFAYTFNGISAFVLVGIAFDRFRKICRPVKPSFTVKWAKRVLIVCAVAGLALSLPCPVVYGTQTFQIAVKNMNGYVTGKTCLVADEQTHTILPVVSIAFMFIVNISIMAALIVLYSLIARTIHIRLRMEKSRKKSLASLTSSSLKDKRPLEVTHCSSEESSVDGRSNVKPSELRHGFLVRQLQQVTGSLSSVQAKLMQPSRTAGYHPGRTTVMLFSVTLAYVLSFTPFTIIACMRSVHPDITSAMTATNESIYNFFLRSYVVNCAINPILYSFFNKDFREKTRRTLVNMCACCKSSRAVSVDIAHSDKQSSSHC